MARSVSKLEAFVRETALPGWFNATSLEPLLRPVDLSGIKRKALAMTHSRRANERLRSAVLRRAREHAEVEHRKVNSEDRPEEQQPSHWARERGDIAAILRRYGPEAGIGELSRSKRRASGLFASNDPKSTASATAEFQAKSHVTHPLRSRADFAASMRRRSVRAGDPTIAHIRVPPELTALEIADLLEPAVEFTEPGPSMVHASAPGDGEQLASGVLPDNGGSAILRIERTLANLRKASTGPLPSRVHRSLYNEREADRAPRAEAPGEVSVAEDAMRGLTAHVSSGTLTADDSHESLQWPPTQPSGEFAAKAPAPAQGLRGLAARVAHRAWGGLAVARVHVGPDMEDFAQRLDQLLRREARRNGIDVEEIDR
jgi:hypothetical protein